MYLFRNWQCCPSQIRQGCPPEVIPYMLLGLAFFILKAFAEILEILGKINKMNFIYT